jgi:putative ATPase
LMTHIGYGKGYRYVHNDPAAKEEMSCLPEQLRGRKYFTADEPIQAAEESNLGEDS